jgi:hypothetical protein
MSYTHIDDPNQIVNSQIDYNFNIVYKRLYNIFTECNMKVDNERENDSPTAISAHCGQRCQQRGLANAARGLAPDGPQRPWHVRLPTRQEDGRFPRPDSSG